MIGVKSARKLTKLTILQRYGIERVAIGGHELKMLLPGFDLTTNSRDPIQGMDSARENSEVSPRITKRVAMKCGA
nr:hypothetical protein Iba_chr03aCG17780 [Ipomoea batatas]